MSGPGPIRGLARLASLLLLESSLLFGAAQLVPGDAASAALGGNATPSAIADMRRQLGLEDNVVQRYLRWLAALTHGDLGTSTQSGLPVRAVIGVPVQDTLLLVGLAGAATITISLTLGILGGLQPDSAASRRLDQYALVAAALPPFVVAALLAGLLAVRLRLLPALSLVPVGQSPWDRPAVLVLPALSLTVVGSAATSRVFRAVIAEARQLPHVDAARLAGLSWSQVLRHHLLPSAVGPLAQAGAWLLASLLGGTIVVEQVFGYPGLGRLLVTAIQTHDVPIMEAAGLIVISLVTLAFAAADAVSGRSRVGERAR